MEAFEAAGRLHGVHDWEAAAEQYSAALAVFEREPAGGVRAQSGCVPVVLPAPESMDAIRSPVAPTLPTSITQRHCPPPLRP